MQTTTPRTRVALTDAEVFATMAALGLQVDTLNRRIAEPGMGSTAIEFWTQHRDAALAARAAIRAAAVR